MVLSLILVSLVVMSLAHTIARERLFAPLRQRLGGHDTWLGYMVSCPYCLSHWIAFVVVPLTGVYYVPVRAGLGAAATWLLRWFLSSVLVAAIAAFLRVVFFFLDEGQGLVRRRKEESQRRDDPR